MIVELKWDKNADTAISQIHERNYEGKLKDHGGELILVEINYDKKAKRYRCKIESET